jgi:predicted ferric reductase
MDTCITVVDVLTFLVGVFAVVGVLATIFGLAFLVHRKDKYAGTID